MKRSEEGRGIVARLSTLDRRILFLIVLACAAIPLLIGASVRLSVGPTVKGMYNAIDSLPPGSYVYLAADYDPGSLPELYPMNVAFVEHLFSKDVKIIAASLWAPGPPLSQRVFDEIAPKYGKSYGVDYVNLGFKEGREAVMVSVAEDLKATFPEDYFGTPYEEIPVLRGIGSLRDVSLIVNVSAGYPGIKEWVQQIATRFGIPIGGGVTAVSGPEMYPYIQSGQLVGLLAGMKGAGEYEQILGKPGLGLAGMAAQSSVHVAVIVFIVLANVFYFMERKKPK
jgi:hypothetical protein